MATSKMSLLSTNNNFHVAMHAGSIILAFITQVITEVFFIMTKEGNVPNALFQNSFRNVSETFQLEVTMDWWSENCWIMVDVWSLAWLSYAVVSLCRRNALGPESCNPEIHPPVFYLMWVTVNITRINSMLLWDKHYILGAVLFRLVLPINSFYMLSISYSGLHKHKAWLAVNNKTVISWTCYLTQNGLAMFAWWALLNTVVGLGIVLKYNNGVSDQVASTIILSIITLCTIIWFTLQSFLFKYMHHTFSTYAILILGLGAMLTSSYRVQDLSINTAICGVLMLLITIMSFFHLLSVCGCMESSRKPLSVDPYLKFDGCETVCQLESNIKQKPLN